MKLNHSLLSLFLVNCLLLILITSCDFNPRISVTDYEVSDIKATSAFLSGHFKLSHISSHNFLYIEISENENFNNSRRFLSARQEYYFHETLSLLHPNRKYYWRLAFENRESNSDSDDYLYSEVNSFETESMEVKDYAVDLGLPSGTLWGKMNVGAYAPSYRGIFVQYGDIKTPENFGDKEYYKWAEKDNNGNYTFTKYYFDNKKELDLEDDAAYMNWGPGWRTPSMQQWEELYNNCTFTFSELDDVDGCVVKSKRNGNSIFLPVTESRAYVHTLEAGKYAGCYWSRTHYTSSSVYNSVSASSWSFFFEVPYIMPYSRNRKTEGKIKFQFEDITNGLVVRPVYNP